MVDDLLYHLSLSHDFIFKAVDVYMHMTRINLQVGFSVLLKDTSAGS